MTIYEHTSVISRIAMFVKGDGIITDMPTLQTAFKTLPSTALSPHVCAEAGVVPYDSY